MEDTQMERLLRAIQTISDTQQKALDTLILRLNGLAERLEPLASIQEGLIAGFDGTVTRMETITLAQAEVAKVSEEAMQFIAEQARQQEQAHHLA